MNKWIDPPSPSDAPRMILDDSEGATFMPRGKQSAFRKADGRFSRITDVRSYVEESGWIDDSGTDLLYVSSGNDPRPLFALAAEGLGKGGIEASDTPTFFVYVDHSHPERPSEPDLRDPKPDSEAMHLEENEGIQVASFPARLLFLTLSPEIGDDRRVAVLRIKANNEEVGILAEAEGWAPLWFVGICDGCNGFGGQVEDRRFGTRCENQVAEDFHSIPLNLGVRYWLTDHLRSGTEPLEVSEDTTLPTGGDLRLIRHWTEWPDSGFFGDPSLYEVVSDGVNR